MNIDLEIEGGDDIEFVLSFKLYNDDFETTFWIDINDMSYSFDMENVIEMIDNREEFKFETG